MITHGTRPARHIRKVKRFEHVFGALNLATLSPFNLDPGLGMRNQEADNASTECTGYTVAEIIASIYKMQFSPDFSYAAARFVEGSGAGDNGASFHAAMDALVIVGALLAERATTTTALARGELYVSDWKNWEPYQKTAALTKAQNGVRNVLGNGDNFSSIVSALYTAKIPVSLGSPWFEEWQGLAPNSLMPVPKNPLAQANDLSTPWHNYVGEGFETSLFDTQTIPIKSHQGFWLYMPREVANAVFDLPGTGALTLDPAAIRWISFLGILARRYPALLKDLPALIASYHAPA